MPERTAGLVDVGFIAGWFRRHALALWFATFSALQIPAALIGTPFLDARLYVAATRSWLAGGDPWATSVGTIGFAAPPPTLLAVAPFALVPEPLGWLLLAGLCLAAIPVTVRMLGLPWWWMLFPPMVQGALSGNVQLLLVPLILARAGWLAAFVKVYAVVPLAILGRWRELAILAVALVVTAPLLPWAAFVGQYGMISATLAEQAAHYAVALPLFVILAPLAVVGLWRLGRERAAWLAVPALWPSQQWYYSAMGIGARSAAAAAVLALPLPGGGLLAVLAAWSVARRSAGRSRPRP